MLDQPTSRRRWKDESRLAAQGSNDSYSDRDPITGFLTRSAGLHVAVRAVAEANRDQSGLVAFWFDIDRFRQINDSFGHVIGDSVIAQIARRIQDIVLKPAEFLRMGSDEFVVLIPRLDRSGTEELARKLLVAIELPLPIDDLLIRPVHQHRHCAGATWRQRARPARTGRPGDDRSQAAGWEPDGRRRRGAGDRPARRSARAR
ncbi:MAG: GGDEF domain-containing protein [Propionivibrio sp.]